MASRVFYLGSAVLLTLWACGSDETTGAESAQTGTGATSSSNTTGSSDGGSGTGGTPEPMCPHMGPDIIDPTTLPACPTTMCAGGARCVPTTLIPPEYLMQLADCDADNKCVPDDFIKTNGNFIPDTCTSIAGAEGRCISECLVAVAAQADMLPADTCPEFQRCAPCYDPITGEATGVCELSCDPGPTQPPVTLPTCCDGLGTCVPAGLVPPEQQMSLPADTCPVDANMYLCAPTQAITDPNWMPEACETDIPLFGGEPGVCLPGCLITGIQGSLVGQSTCPTDYKCAPCDDPFGGGPTGACDL
jgi:hypothetical protein